MWTTKPRAWTRALTALGFILMLLLAACGPTPEEPVASSDRNSMAGLSASADENSAEPGEMPAHEAPAAPAGSTTAVPSGRLVPVQGQAPAAYTPDVSFTLRTAIADGRLAFVGVGGTIDGQVNPTLQVQLDEVVQVTLINGDGALHDVAFPDFGARSEQVVSIGASTALVFRADQRGEFFYFCTVPGHRQAGMEGLLVVGDEEAQVEPEGVSIVRDPTDVSTPVGGRSVETVRLELETIELEGRLADGTTYTYWTFNGTVPGPFLRVRHGDTVEVTLRNREDSIMIHSVDLHAVTGPGGGAAVTQAAPGQERVFTFQALNPGLYVYHCATPMVANHITNGMYGLILVEPEGGLPPVDREFYVMQGEFYTEAPFGQHGHQSFSVEKLLDEEPEYIVLNGAVGALSDEHPLQARVGETVRIYFGVGGPNLTSSFHVIGEVLDRVYDQASLTAAPLTDVQTTLVPAGGATMVEFTLDVPGRYILVDHSLSRLERGLVGYLIVEGEPNDAVFHEGQAE